MTAAIVRGAPIPRQMLPYCEFCSSDIADEVLPLEEDAIICIRTLMLSKGCPTIMPALPATPPAMRSCSACVLGRVDDDDE